MTPLSRQAECDRSEVAADRVFGFPSPYGVLQMGRGLSTPRALQRVRGFAGICRM